MSSDELLAVAATSGIIDLAELEIMVNNMKKKEIVENNHQYSIWQCKGKWLTHIKDTDGKLKIRRRNSEEELIEYLADFYSNYKREIYLEDVFNEWINSKLQYQEIRKQSYDRYISDFERFFGKENDIYTKQVKYITEIDLERFIKECICTHNLTKKSYSGLVTLLKGIFRYAKKRGETSISITNFFGDLIIPNSMFEKRHIDKEKEVFNENEIGRVIAYLKNNPDVWNLGLLLQFQSGARVGEIAALKHEDCTLSSIFIRRTEVKYKNEKGKWDLMVSSIPKTDAGYREIFLPPDAQWTIQKILELNPKGEYLFENKQGKRIRSGTFNHRLSRICDKLNIPHRSTHKIRKTYGTTLIDNNVADSVVANQLGHTTVETTRRFYYFDNKSREKKQQQIATALSTYKAI